VWKDLITGENEHAMENFCDKVKGLVRKLSKLNLADLAPMDDDEAPHFQNKHGTVIRRVGANHPMSCEKRSMDSSAVMCLYPQM